LDAYRLGSRIQVDSSTWCGNSPKQTIFGSTYPHRARKSHTNKTAAWRMRYDIICEPSGSNYAELIRFCSRIASTGLVVVNEPQVLAVTAKAFLSALSPHLIDAK